MCLDMQDAPDAAGCDGRASALAALPPRDELDILDQFAERDAETLAIARRLGVDGASVVLDLGCGRGGFLRGLGVGERVGVDRNPEVIEEAIRRSDGTIRFEVGRSTALPFADDTFSHVFCLNALTYMPVAASLAEMARVLRPDGHLVLRFETVVYDLSRLRRRPATLRETVSGVVLALTGIQLPHNALFGRRLFLSRGRLRRRLARLGLAVIEARPHPGTPTYRGRPTQMTLVASAASSTPARPGRRARSGGRAAPPRGAAGPPVSGRRS